MKQLDINVIIKSLIYGGSVAILIATYFICRGGTELSFLW